MDTKANLSNRKKINELAIQHNKLTTLVACLLNEVSSLKKELIDIKNSDNVSSRNLQSINDNNSNQNQKNNNSNPNRFPNFNDLRAEDILKQLSINSSDN
jgi:septal ring factor EnvC (AmiA/AmiB activator)